MDKNWSLVPKNVQMVVKNGKNCTFCTKNEVFAKKFRQNVQILDKNWSFVHKMYIWSRKNKKIVLFTLKRKFLQKHFH